MEEDNEPGFAGQIWGRIRFYRVFRISENTNSFGLRGVWLMRRNGETWEVGISHLQMRRIKKGSILKVAQVHAQDRPPNWSEWGEIPRRIKPDPPQEVIEEVWNGATVDDVLGWPNDYESV